MISFPQETDSRSISQARPEFSLSVGQEDSTTGVNEQALSFNMAGEPDPVRPAREDLLNMEDPRVAHQVDLLLSAIRRVVEIIREARTDLSRMPALHGHPEPDGSALLEWIFPNFRIGFNVEPDPDNSGWHFVSKEYTASGPIKSTEAVAAMLLEFILPNA
jgi:hypothetical protein